MDYKPLNSNENKINLSINNNKHNICSKNNIILSPVRSKQYFFRNNNKLNILNNIFILSNNIYTSDEKNNITNFKLPNSDKFKSFLNYSGIDKILSCKPDTIALIMILYYLYLTFNINKHEEIFKTQSELSKLNY